MAGSDAGPKATSGDHTIIRPVEFQAEGGIDVTCGGQSVGGTWPARVFQSQDEFAEAFEAGELNEDMVVVLPGQGLTMTEERLLG